MVAYLASDFFCVLSDPLKATFASVGVVARCSRDVRETYQDLRAFVWEQVDWSSAVGRTCESGAAAGQIYLCFCAWLPLGT